MLSHKIKVSILALFLIAALLLTAGAAYAQVTGFDLSWWTTDSGGGDLSGPGFTLSGTMGQPEAGTLGGDGYTLDGGFWGGGILPEGEMITIYLPMVTR